jgi:hypothetical protein
MKNSPVVVTGMQQTVMENPRHCIEFEECDTAPNAAV